MVNFEEIQGSRGGNIYRGGGGGGPTFPRGGGGPIAYSIKKPIYLVIFQWGGPDPLSIPSGSALEG